MSDAVNERLYYGLPYFEEYVESVSETLEQLDASPGETYEVYEYKPVRVAPEWLTRMADHMTEEWEQAFCDEYGQPEEMDEPTANGSSEEMLALLKRWSEGAYIWRCEPTGRVFHVEAASDYSYIIKSTTEQRQHTDGRIDITATLGADKETEENHIDV